MQLALYAAGEARGASQAAKAGEAGRASEARRMCAACQAREARYGFRDGGSGDGDTSVDRPRTLCFDCFRMEIDRRRVVAAQLARGWNATQAALPLSGTLEALSRRRRRAQIAARHALALR
jgi:hypothetical protein